MKEWKAEKKYDFHKIKELPIESILEDAIVMPKFDGETTFLFFDPKMSKWVTCNNWGHYRTDYRVTEEAEKSTLDKKEVYVGELIFGKNLYDFLRHKKDSEGLRLVLFEVLEDNPSQRTKRNFEQRLRAIPLQEIYLEDSAPCLNKELHLGKVPMYYYHKLHAELLLFLFQDITKTYEGMVVRGLKSEWVMKVKKKRTLDVIVMGMQKKGKSWEKGELGSFLVGLYSFKDHQIKFEDCIPEMLRLIRKMGSLYSRREENPCLIKIKEEDLQKNPKDILNILIEIQKNINRKEDFMKENGKQNSLQNKEQKDFGEEKKLSTKEWKIQNSEQNIRENKENFVEFGEKRTETELMKVQENIIKESLKNFMILEEGNVNIVTTWMRELLNSIIENLCLIPELREELILFPKKKEISFSFFVQIVIKLFTSILEKEYPLNYHEGKLLKVGTVGFPRPKERKALFKVIMDNKTSEDKHYVYVSPKMVMEIIAYDFIETTEYDSKKTFRSPIFQRWRPDKPSSDCLLEHQFPEALE